MTTSPACQRTCESLRRRLRRRDRVREVRRVERGCGAGLKLSIVVTDAVWDELTDPARLRSDDVAQRQKLLSAIAGAPFVLAPQTREALIYAQLEIPETRRFGVGERSVIAYAICHDDSCAVLMDKLAIHRAIEELPSGRVLSLHGLLWALEQRGLSARVADEVSRTWLRSNPPHRQPLCVARAPSGLIFPQHDGLDVIGRDGVRRDPS